MTRILHFIKSTYITGILEQQYIMTAIRVGWGKVRYGVPQGSSFSSINK
jgi:hypothetical protein